MLTVPEVSGSAKLELIRTGNSTGVILPKQMLEKPHVRKADALHTLEFPDGYHLRA